MKIDLKDSYVYTFMPYEGIGLSVYKYKKQLIMNRIHIFPSF